MNPAVGVEAVTLDFYNTLVFHRGSGRGARLMEFLQAEGLASDPWEHQVLYDVFEPHAREYSPAHSSTEKHAYLSRLAERVFQRLNVRAAPGAAAGHATTIWELIGPHSLTVFPDVRPALDRLTTAGYRLAVISNWQCGLAHFCTELGIAQYFEHVVSSAEVGCAKPSREIFELACQRLGVAPDRVLHVGDTPADDLEGAHAAGMRAVLIDRDHQTPHSIRSLEGILHILDALKTREP
ncbi:MAG TPA: HAD family hydrolase [Longimicrobiales bacterium]|nr:HAD family hydrolase [Longimicrobiales bacterium]